MAEAYASAILFFEKLYRFFRLVARFLVVFRFFGAALRFVAFLRVVFLFFGAAFFLVARFLVVFLLVTRFLVARFFGAAFRRFFAGIFFFCVFKIFRFDLSNIRE